MKKPVTPPRAEQRIAKLLARAGIASRREIERMIDEGRVALNGEAITTPATVLASLSGVTVDGQPVREAAPARLFRYHKPAGLLTAERDPAGRPTIYDRLPRDLPRVMPVGRLDLNTEGLLLMTTDGEFKRELELPATGVERRYRARTFGPISQEQLEHLIHGIEIEGVRYGSIDANLERRTGRNQWIEMRLREGKNREVRRVLEHLGLQVSRLIRTAYGPFVLGDLPPGAVDEVRQHDLVVFRKSLNGLQGSSLPAAPLDQQAEASRAPRPAAARPATPRPQPAHRAPAPRQDDRERERPANPSPRRPPPRAQGQGAARDSLHHRPPREAAQRPTRAAQSARRTPPPAAKSAPAPESASERPKRGAGWAKAKPRPSSRPTRRGSAKGSPTRGRPDGNKR